MQIHVDMSWQIFFDARADCQLRFDSTPNLRTLPGPVLSFATVV